MNFLTPRYGSILQAVTQEEAEAFLSTIVDDMMSWPCWCVTPSRQEVDVIERKNCIVYGFYEAGPTTAAQIASLLGVSDLSFLPEKQ